MTETPPVGGIREEAYCSIDLSSIHGIPSSSGYTTSYALITDNAQAIRYGYSAAGDTAEQVAKRWNPVRVIPLLIGAAVFFPLVLASFVITAAICLPLVIVLGVGALAGGFLGGLLGLLVGGSWEKAKAWAGTGAKAGAAVPFILIAIPRITLAAAALYVGGNLIRVGLDEENRSKKLMRVTKVSIFDIAIVIKDFQASKKV